MLNNEGDAMKMFRKALSIDSTYSDAYIEMARLYKRNKDFDGARDMYLLALEKDSSAHKVNYKLGDLYCYDLAYYPNAIESYLKYMKYFPDDKDVFIDLGNAYYYNSQYDEAMIAYNKYKEYDADYKGIYLDIANCNAALYDTVNAVKNYYRAIDIDSSYSKAWKALSDIQVSMGLYQEAIKGYLNAMKYDTNYNYLNYTIGQVYLSNLKDYDNSEKYYKQYVELYPDKYFGYQGLGYTYLKSGKTKKSLDLFLLAMQKDPAEPWNYYNLACYYSLNGDKQKAVENLEKAFEKGYDNLEHAKIDSDLESIRNMPEFDAIIKKYTKDK
jgi:tetratricopeptide (TPR) repeat protein